MKDKNVLRIKETTAIISDDAIKALRPTAKIGPKKSQKNS
jgi:hypothetical protein